jgi:hypothetical protein
MKALLCVILVACAVPVYAESTYLSGKITNITSGTSGLMIMLDSGVPDNCQGTPYNWMLIPEANKTMIATILLFYSSDKNKIYTIYTQGCNPGEFCIINQVDPSE